jgi:hypothetical protein
VRDTRRGVAMSAGGRTIAFRSEIRIFKVDRGWYVDLADIDAWIAAYKERAS